MGTWNSVSVQLMGFDFASAAIPTYGFHFGSKGCLTVFSVVPYYHGSLIYYLNSDAKDNMPDVAALLLLQLSNLHVSLLICTSFALSTLLLLVSNIRVPCCVVLFACVA